MMMEDQVVAQILSMCDRSRREDKPKRKPPKIREMTVVEIGGDPESITHQVCNKCWDILGIEDFPRVKSSGRWIPSRVCRACHSERMREYFKTPKGRAGQNARNIKRHADKLNRTPAWADLNAIKFFYECCPKGCHVDHIIPMRGENISGLHVETNLQWLTAEQNLRKNNKYG